MKKIGLFLFLAILTTQQQVQGAASSKWHKPLSSSLKTAAVVTQTKTPTKPFVKLPPLQRAAKFNDVDKILPLLNKGIDPTCQDHTGGTAVHWAASLGNIEVLNRLILYNSAAVKKCLNIQDHDGKTPLHWASSKDTGCTELLIQYASKEALEIRDAEGYTPLMWAVTACNENATIALITHTNIHASDTFYSSNALLCALHKYKAIEKKDGVHHENLKKIRSIIRLLLFKGVKLEWQDSSGATAVHLAAMLNNADILQEMIDCNKEQVRACLWIQDEAGETPFHKAVMKVGCTEALLTCAPADTIDIRDGRGYTPLMWAATMGNYHAVMKLIFAGADVNTRDSLNGKDPLFCALHTYNAVQKSSSPNVPDCLDRMTSLIRLLLYYGAKIDHPNITGTTAVHWAAILGNVAALKEMIVYNKKAVQASLSIQDEAGKTPLHLATRTDSGCTELLLSCAPPGTVDIADCQDTTPLIWAASAGNESAVAALLKRGANPNTKDNCKLRTPLHWVLRMRQGNVEKKGKMLKPEKVQSIIRLLIEEGANPELKDLKKMSPIGWALTFDFKKEYTLLTGKQFPTRRKK